MKQGAGRAEGQRVWEGSLGRVGNNIEDIIVVKKAELWQVPIPPPPMHNSVKRSCAYPNSNLCMTTEGKGILHYDQPC